MSWTIIPYVSVGLLTFGMTPQEVARHIGPPESVSNAMPAGAPQELQDKYADHIVEFRIGGGGGEMKPSVRYEAGKAVSFDLFETLPGVEINGYRPFEHPMPAALARLKQESVHYVEDKDGVIFFLDFGLSISNGDNWDEVPPINVFARGDFDELIEESVKAGEANVVRK
ncbi:hypothetical protein [Terrihabitans sp. B22-R8]|uniref:hypothetical protein n=1 Tax=Terrihabitans sp. B22-R8 TaxID=3425128 RepID=UPI00403C6593